MTDSPLTHERPRLYLGPAAIRRLKTPVTLPLLKKAAAVQDREAEEYVRSATFAWERNTHNAHLLRARTQQRRVTALLVQWIRTGEARFRDAAVAHLREMAGWDVWSWITWREGRMEPEAIYDLSYGENAATLAVAWDLLHDTLTRDERDLVIGMVRKWVVPSFLQHTEPGKEMWWYKAQARNCNWLAVCAGGAGLAALSLYEEVDEAAEMLRRADEGVTGFMRSLKASGGGWSEGVGYWNYGMRYAFMFLLSHEQATGRKHPAFDLPETLDTLRFPLEFAPGGKACGFGDIGATTWRPIATHYAAAERLSARDVLQGLDAQPHDDFEKSWPTATELLALHPGVTSHGSGDPAASDAVKLYSGLGWGRMADRMPLPSFYVAIRGGTTKDPHNSADLLSWHALVDGERLVSSITNREYIDTTFSGRRFELPEVRPDTKNTILIGGVGMAHPAESVTERVVVGSLPGIRIDITAGYRITGGELFVGRLFLWLDGEGLLILDAVELKHTNRIETRLHTYATLSAGDGGAVIQGESATLQIGLAATARCRIGTSVTTPTNVSEPPASVLRWATAGLESKMMLATLAVPGRVTPTVDMSVADDQVIVGVDTGTRKRRLAVTWRLADGQAPA